MARSRPIMDVARVQGRAQSAASAVAAESTAVAVAVATDVADGSTAAKDGDGARRRFVTALAERPRVVAPLSPPVDHGNAADGVVPVPDAGCVMGPDGGGDLQYLDLPVHDTQLLLRVDMSMNLSSDPVSPRPCSSALLWDDECAAAQQQADAIAEAFQREDDLVLPASLASPPASVSSSTSLPAVSGLPLAPSVSVALLEKISRLPQRSSSGSRAATAFSEYLAPAPISRSGRCSRLPSLNEDEDTASAPSSALPVELSVLVDASPDVVGATGCRSSAPAACGDGGDDGALGAANLEQERAARRRYRSISRGRPVRAAAMSSSSGVALLSRGRSLVRMANGTQGSRPASLDVGLVEGELGGSGRSRSAIAPAMLRATMMGLPPVTAVGSSGGGGGGGGGSGSGGIASAAHPHSHSGSISALQRRRSHRRVGLTLHTTGDVASRQSSDEGGISDGSSLAASPPVAADLRGGSPPLVGRSDECPVNSDGGGVDRRELAHGSITDLSTARQAGDHYAARLECSPRVRYRRLSCGRRPVVLEVMPVVGEDRLTPVHVSIAERCARARSGSPCRTREMVVTLRGGKTRGGGGEERTIWHMRGR